MEFTVDWHSHHAATWHQFLDSHTGQPVRCLEIGSHEGRSAVWTIRNLLSHPEASLTCVDPWPNPRAEQRFDANIIETGRADQVQKYKAESFKILPLLQPGFDFIYVDGHHEGRHVMEDAIQSFRLLAVDGILIFDDYCWKPRAVVHPPGPAIDAFLLLWSDCLEVLHQESQVIVRKWKQARQPPQCLRDPDANRLLRR